MLDDDICYSVREMASLMDCSMQTVRDRIAEYKITPVLVKAKTSYYSSHHLKIICEKAVKSCYVAESIVKEELSVFSPFHRTEVYHIFESKINNQNYEPTNGDGAEDNKFSY